MFHQIKTPVLLCLLIAATGVSLVLCHTQSQQANYHKDVNDSRTGGIKKPCHVDCDFSGSRKHTQVNSVELRTTAAVDVSGNTQLNIHACSPWSFFNGTACVCGNDVNGVVYCNPDMNFTFVLNCYCMTYDNVTDTVVLGSCIYNCFNHTKTAILPHSLYHLLPPSVDDLNGAMCSHFSRRGQLCSRCTPDFSIPAYSYSLHCIRCTYRNYNWIKYLVIALGPLTLFFFIVITFRISVTLPPLLVFVQVCHTLSAPQLVRNLLAGLESANSRSLVAQVLISLYGIWNLDFFRTLLPPICLQLTTLQTIALDYVIAFYPLVLVAITYILVELHDHNFRPIVWLWKPFHRCFARIRRQWNIKTSIIDAFATFLVLSYLKFISVSTDLLLPTRLLFNVHGKTHHMFYVYNDAAIEYFGKEHIPYAIMAFTVLLFVVILPLVLLVLYPCQCFQRCLTCCRLRTHALHIFMDAFQGCYKDGTNGTRDCRWFASVYLGARLISYLLYALTLNGFFYPLVISMYMMIIILLIAVQPYSSPIYNIVDPIVMVFLSLFGVVAFTISNAFATLPKQFLEIAYVASLILYCIPLVYMSGAFLYWTVVKRRIPQRVMQWCRPNRCLHTELEASLADRLIHPEQYERLLPDPVGEEQHFRGRRN